MDLIQLFIDNPNLKKENSEKLAKRFGVTVEQIKEARKSLTCFSKKLHSLDLPLEAVKDVKFWDAPNGKQRFSINTKKEWYKQENQKTVEEAINSIKEKFQAEIKPVTISVEEKDNRKALFIYTADKHVGAKTSSNSMMNNPYNATVFKERMLSILVTIKKNKDLFGVFDALYIIDLGDSLDGYNGQTTRGGHVLPQNLDNGEQLDTFFEVHKELFDGIVQLKAAKRIEYIACTNDNHSGAFGYAAQRMLDIYLQCQYPDIKRTIIKQFIDHIQYGQHTFMFTHGKDEKDMKFGLPLKLNEKAENYINAYIHYHKIQTPNIHLIKGDLHQSAEEPAKTFRYKNVLSLYGASKWIHTNFMTNVKGYNYEIVDKYSPEIYKSEITF